MVEIAFFTAGLISLIKSGVAAAPAVATIAIATVVVGWFSAGKYF